MWAETCIRSRSPSHEDLWGKRDLSQWDGSQQGTKEWQTILHYHIRCGKAKRTAQLCHYPKALKRTQAHWCMPVPMGRAVHDLLWEKELTWVLQKQLSRAIDFTQRSSWRHYRGRVCDFFFFLSWGSKNGRSHHSEDEETIPDRVNHTCNCESFWKLQDLIYFKNGEKSKTS